ncbi:LysR family transcriptional regulator [Hyalangium versicolor]|uniref:LysR family transcriptional regulator n=1 Tax=Hyalangium versicolor TaxID=2861190 RepID=UPI001CCB7000|nr:LysR family transcriptional regulator [Hyalangium versicolor]
MEDWNDLKLALAISRAGSLTAAARALGVAHSTAFRRLGALEQKLGVRLFERLPGGAYMPTDAGERIAAAAERVETETASLGRELLGADLRLSGRLRVTCPESLAYGLLTQWVAEFRREHPGITLEMVADHRVLNLSRREADVALRVSRPREGDLYGRKLAEIGTALYARPDLLKRHGPLAAGDYERHPFIAWEESVTGINTADWLQRHVPEKAVVFRSNSLLSQMAAAREGIGVVLLPCYFGDAEPTLVRARPAPLPELNRELWIVAHRDLRRTARVRAFIDLVEARAQECRIQLAGSASRQPRR